MKIPESRFTPVMLQAVGVAEAFTKAGLDPFSCAVAAAGIIRTYCDRLATPEFDVDKAFFVEFIQAEDLQAFFTKWIDKSEGRD